MTFQDYKDYFKSIIENSAPIAPYDDPEYIEYTKLNWSRSNRILKHGVINEELSDFVKNIQTPQSWIVITEPWCGDAAQIVPYFHLISTLNPLISIDFELRDAPPNRIDQYLSNGSKSISILIVRDNQDKDLFIWGPRPEPANVLVRGLKEKDVELDELKIAIQQWYNQDKGVSLQKELLKELKRNI